MIRHIVLCRFRADVSESEIAEIWAGLEALKDVIPGMIAASFGANVSPEGLARGYGHAFTMDFENETVRDAYLEHPAHKAAGARLVGALDGGVDGLCVLDFGV